MSSFLQSSNEDSSSDSIESFGNALSSPSAKDTHESTESIQRSSLQTSMALVRLDNSHPELPNIQPHQHSTLFYLSLIEGRCRTQAATALNAGRVPEDYLPENHPEVHALAQHLFGEMTKELHRAGVLPDEFAGQELSEVRKSYLSSFDNILHNIAAKKKQEFQDSNTYSSLFDRSNSYALGRDFISNSIANGKAFALQKYSIMAPSAQQLLPMLSSLSLEDTTIYKSKFKQIRLLGKGGFGKVYESLHRLDGRAYAIKKVVMKGDTLSGNSAKEKAEGYLSELRALASLNHRNIVRYHNSWAETQLVKGPGDSSSSESDEEADECEQTRSTQAGRFKTGDKARMPGPGAPCFRDNRKNELALKRGLTKEARHVRRVSRTVNDYDDSIRFEYSATSDKKALVGPKSKFFHAAGSGSSDEDSDDGTEEVARSGKVDQNPLSGLEIVIFIQMALHPMNLEDYLWPEQQNSDGGLQLQHCYHTIPTACILLGILDGVEYIHRNEIVHRDLKPSNIMLSVSEKPVSVLDGYIKVSDCVDCSRKKHSKSKDIYLIPHIADFGLVADIQDTESERSPTLVSNTALVPKTDDGSFLPPALSGLSSRQPGTRFYCAPKPLKGKAIICPKVDVYSLGIIALEMIYRFGTRTERVIELDKLTKHGVLPEGFETHEMADGIKQMLCNERHARWGCDEVRKWLKGFTERTSKESS